jgi:hypothetical protein
LIELHTFKLCKIKNERSLDSARFDTGLSFLSQDIENLQKHAELFLIERHAAYRREGSIGRPNKEEVKLSMSLFMTLHRLRFG